MMADTHRPMPSSVDDAINAQQASTLSLLRTAIHQVAIVTPITRNITTQANKCGMDVIG